MKRARTLSVFTWKYSSEVRQIKLSLFTRETHSEYLVTIDVINESFEYWKKPSGGNTKASLKNRLVTGHVPGGQTAGLPTHFHMISQQFNEY